jgi:hypothetical protein
MNAYCRPEQYDDFDVMADIAMSITARKGQGTAVRREIARELREFSENSASPSLSPAVPRVEEENPSRYPHCREGDMIMGKGR